MLYFQNTNDCNKTIIETHEEATQINYEDTEKLINENDGAIDVKEKKIDDEDINDKLCSLDEPGKVIYYEQMQQFMFHPNLSPEEFVNLYIKWFQGVVMIGMISIMSLRIENIFHGGLIILFLYVVVGNWLCKPIIN